MTTLVTLRPGLTLEAGAAASWARMEAERGRPLDVNRATVSRADQFEKYYAYLAYKAGRGPWAPLALHPDDSWHCYPTARAVDTDDDAWIRAHPDHGWRFVVKDEKWHAQYYPNLDKHRNDPAPAGTGKPITLEDIMTKTREAFYVLHEGNLFLGRQMGGLVHVQPVDLDVWSGGTQSAGYWNLKRTDENGKAVDDGPLMLEEPPTFDTQNNPDAWASVVRFCGGPGK